MNMGRENIQNMMKGFRTLDQYWDQNKLHPLENLKVKVLTLAIILLKIFYRPIKNLFFGKFNILEGMDKHQGHKLRAVGQKRKKTDNGFYLSQDEVDNFEKNGVLGPFKVLEPEEANRLAQYVQDLHNKKEFQKNSLMGKKIINAFQQANQNSINYTGIFQALNYQKISDVLCKPEITHRISSLLGDDLICWRSQFFEKKPKSIGTFWHQASTFRESSKRPKLIPSNGIDLGMSQLSVWLSLRDSTIENGCLRILKGSFRDSRIEKLGFTIADNIIAFLMTQPNEKIQSIIKTIFFTPGNFFKAQLLFEIALDLFPDIFSDLEVIDLPMKAGEAIIFTELNMHASYPNVINDIRLAMGGRYTRNDTKVYWGMDKDTFPTPKGNISFDLKDFRCIQVLGKDKYQFNRIVEKFEDGR